MLDISLDHLYQFELTKGRTVPNHSHDCYEFCYYLEGGGTTGFGGKEIPYSAMHYAVYAPGLTHNETHTLDVTVLCLTFHVQHDEDISIISGVYSDIDKIILEKFERVRHEFANKKPGYKTMIELLIAELLICYDRQQNQHQFQLDGISRIRALIDVHFANDINIEELAKASGYSYHHFRHIFKNRVGDSPKNYVIRKRIEYAQSMLLRGSICISEIALVSGFSTSSQFANIFKKYTGLTPTQYRLKGAN